VKLWITAASIFFVPIFISAQTPAKTCDDVKAEIAKKLDAKGVIGYTLTVVDKGTATQGKVIGSCGGGKKDIVYERATPTPAPAPDPKPAPEKKQK